MRRVRIADLQHHRVAVGAVDQMMAVGIARFEGGAIARPQLLLPAIGNEGQLTLDHHDEFVLMAVPVPLARPDAGRDAGEIDPEGREPREASQPAPGVAEAGAVERRWVVAGALDRDRAEIELLHRTALR